MYKKVIGILACITVLCTGCASENNTTEEAATTVSEETTVAAAEDTAAETEETVVETETEADVVETTEMSEAAVEEDVTSAAEAVAEPEIEFVGITEEEVNNILLALYDNYINYNCGRAFEADTADVFENECGTSYRITTEGINSIDDIKAFYYDLYTPECVDAFFRFDSPSDMGLNTLYFENDNKVYMRDDWYDMKDKERENKSGAEGLKIVNFELIDENNCIISFESFATGSELHISVDFDIKFTKLEDGWRISEFPTYYSCDIIYSIIHECYIA